MDKSRLRTISSLALPIMGGMVSQNVMNLVDTGMVGQLGEESLAAVGLASFLTFLSQAFLIGLATGVQAMVARRYGEGNQAEMALPLNGGLLFAVVLGVPLAAVLYLLAPAMLDVLVSEPEVQRIAIPYYQTRLFAVVAVACNFSFRGYWNGVNLSKLYLRTLVVMHVVNAVANYVLIFGKFGAPALGATGAAMGTALSTYVGTAMYVVLALQHARHAGFLQGLPSTETLKTILRLSTPTGIQQTFFAGGLTCFMVIVEKVGTSEAAAANVLVNIMLVGLLPGLGLGLAATSLVGQALGRHDPADARQWGFDVLKVGVAILVAIGLPMVLVPDLLLSVFITEPQTIAVGRWPLVITGAALWIDVGGMILMNALLGAGDTKRVAGISIGLQWLLFLPLAYLIGPVWGGGLLAIWGLQYAYRALQSVVFWWMWKGQGWEHIRV